MSDSIFSRVVFMCHAPIVVPSMGGSRAELCATTTESMFKAAKEISDTKPDRVIVLNPHLTHYPNAYTCVSMPLSVRGDFKAFGRPDLQVEFSSEPAFYEYLAQITVDNQFPIEILDAKELDHGSAVPLWFLQSVGFKGAICVIGYPWRIYQEDHTEFGRILRQACENYEGSTAIIASGDMSHRLQNGAPAGYHRRAHIFDDTFRAHLEAGELLEASQIPVDLCDLAAEDSTESMAIVAGALGNNVSNVKLLSYEAPFGVGYLVAVLA